MSTLTITLNAEDFENLWDSSMAWSGNDWELQDKRFEPQPKYDWKYSYWFDSYSALLIARDFLTNQNCPSTTHADNAGGWVLLTNFVSPCWSL
jgi:hypothetical protein